MFAQLKKFFSNNNARAQNHEIALELKKKGDVCVLEERFEQSIEYYRQSVYLQNFMKD